MKNFWGLALIAISLTGCSSVRNDTKHADRLVKQFLPLPGKAALYLYYKENGTVHQGPVQLFLSRGDSFEASHRAEEWAMLPSSSFTRADLEPGKHGVVALYMPAKQKSALFLPADITVEAGKCYFWEMMPREGILFVKEEAAKSAIAGMHLTQSFLSDLEPHMLFSRPPNLRHRYERIMVTAAIRASASCIFRSSGTIR
jgi:hypothetical protein